MSAPSGEPPIQTQEVATPAEVNDEVNLSTTGEHAQHPTSAQELARAGHINIITSMPQIPHGTSLAHEGPTTPVIEGDRSLTQVDKQSLKKPSEWVIIKNKRLDEMNR